MPVLQDSSWQQKYGDQTFETNDNQPIFEGERSPSEGDTCASRLSPIEPPFNGRNVSLNTGAPDTLPESFVATRQLAPSWNPVLPPFLELDSQLGIFSWRASPHGSSGYPTPRTDSATDLVFKIAPTQYHPSVSYGPMTEQEYQVPECVQDYGGVYASVASTQEPTFETSTTTVPIGEMLVDPATARETLGVPGCDIMSSSVYYHSSTIPHSLHRNKDVDFISASHAGRHPITSSFIASSTRVARAGRNHTRFSCHVCDVSFVQRQGLNRHNRDKHQPRNICPHCGVFEWSPARHYLFTKHFERDHPSVPH
ncbi:hypothetical protein EDB87DRAFT_1170391 [Lactarius vividus]|nr:hypothetical protein EDB87DRAFT_1170391 [Lactarius vividus]